MMTEDVVDFRVTSVWQNNKKAVVFCGVPLHSESIRVSDAKRLVVVKAKPQILNITPTIGQQWRVSGISHMKSSERGHFVINEQYFSFPGRCEVTLPHDGENFIKFLSKEKDFKGIGEVKARELWSFFGSNIFDVLANKDRDKLKSCLSDTLIDSLINGYEKYANLKYATWLNDRDIPSDIQAKLFKYHKADSIQALIDNPYRLVTFGMSFTKADGICRHHFNLAETDPRRLIAAVETALKRHIQRGGHTVAKHSDIYPFIKNLLKSSVLASLALSVSNTEKTYFIDAERGTYHYTPYLIMEKVVAKRFNYLNSLKHQQSDQILLAFSRACEELPYDLTERQCDAVLTSLCASISCITGGAGTGKTTVLRTVLRAYRELGFKIKAIALSGRAAMRLHQSIGLKTSTIAAFLRDDPIEDDVLGTLIVIDEASMVDLPTMYRLITHTNPNVRFLFVGDPNQLPPIGAGLILADIVGSGVIPNTELDIVKRQDASTGIPEYSRMIKDGIVPPQLSVGNVVFHEVSTEQIARRCVELYKQDPKNTQIIAATRRMTSAINRLCQQEINPDRPMLQFDLWGDKYVTDLLLGDPVLFTKNNYDANVQNGSLGQLISVEQQDESLGIVRLDDTLELIRLTPALLDSLEAGYGITLHKAQGSQFKRVVVALENSKMVDRSWIYTAITRAEESLQIVGSLQSVRDGVAVSGHNLRMTALQLSLV